jgi:4-amino-4-deoxy-L-arabinose transferase-like glycosyltransferase
LILLFRGAEALLGPHGYSVRLLATVWAAGLVTVLSLLVARVSTQRLGLLTGLICVILSVGPRIEGFAANGELLAALPSAAALLLFAVWLTGRGGRGWLVGAGALAGFAILVKQSGYDGGGAIALWLLLAAWRGWRPRGEALRALGLVVVGAALPIGLAALHGALTGWHEWWFAVADYRLSVESVATGSASDKLSLLWDSLAWSWWCLTPFLLVPWGVAELRRFGPNAYLLAAWAGFALTGFALGGLFHPHYYVGLIAPASALAALGIERLRREHGQLATRVVVAALFLPVVVGAWPTYTAGSANAASLASTHDRRVLSDAAVADYLDARTGPNDRIYALYADAGLYFAADRMWPYRYLWFLGVQHIPGALDELRAVLAGPRAPRYIVQYQEPRTIDKRGVISGILARRYRLETTIDGLRVYRLVR